MRLIIDNDFSGDPDDLFQLVHHVLSPSVEIRGIIGSHLSPDDPFDSSTSQAENAVRTAEEILDLLNAKGRYPVWLGSNTALTSETDPIDTEAARGIIAEAMRADTDLPLYVALGAGLTELASAYLLEPRIAERLTAIWIGGNEHADLATPPPDAAAVEYNLNVDILAAQVIFNDSPIRLWQVPRNVYRQCLVSQAELEVRVRSMGALGDRMARAIDDLAERAGQLGHPLGETYALGDSPLVLLTALQSAFEPDPSSSFHVTKPTPRLNSDGSYSDIPSSRPMRVYTDLDTRLMFEDFFLKLKLFATR
ncbi:nucleoside hydrolase [Humibacter ginsengisoli]